MRGTLMILLKCRPNRMLESWCWPHADQLGPNQLEQHAWRSAHPKAYVANHEAFPLPCSIEPWSFSTSTLHEAIPEYKSDLSSGFDTNWRTK